jgi:hypothetical protein
MKTYRERIINNTISVDDFTYIRESFVDDILDEIEQYVDDLKYLIDDYEIKQARTKLAELGEELY